MKQVIKSYAEACTSIGIDPAILPDVSKIHSRFQSSTIANYKLMVWIEAVNGKNQPDWAKRDQYKYEPRFVWSASAGAFVYDGCDGWRTDANVGGRLCFTDYKEFSRTKDIPEFMQLINEMLMVPVAG